MHGVLIQVRDCGVLITGPAASGKSQLGLELLSRGHRFVADDVICLSLKNQAVMGQGLHESREFLALRCGVVVDVARQFGAQALLPECSIDMVVSPGPALVPLANPPQISILNQDRPQFYVQTLPGSAVSVEALVQAWHDRAQGYDAAAVLAQRQAARIAAADHD